MIVAMIAPSIPRSKKNTKINPAGIFRDSKVNMPKLVACGL